MADRRRKLAARGNRRRGGLRRMLRAAGQRILRARSTLAVVAAALVACSGLVWLGATSPRLAVREVRISRCEHVSAQELRRLAQVRPGANIFRVDLAEIQRRLEGHPWIARAYVRRSLPSRIVVRVVEHRPVAIVHLEAEHLYYIDDEGRIFKRVEKDDPRDLPVLSGLTPKTLLEGPDADRRLRAALDLARTAARWAPQFGGLSDVRVGALGDLSIVTERDGLLVRLGKDGFEEKLGRLARTVELLGPDVRRVARIDLGNPARAVVRMNEPDGGRG